MRLPSIWLTSLAHLLDRRLAGFLRFVDVRFTPLAMLVLIIAGSAVIWITAYLFRYSRWDYWHWKTHAVSKTMALCVILICTKVILRSMR